jgi:hypothetical protein
MWKKRSPHLASCGAVSGFGRAFDRRQRTWLSDSPPYGGGAQDSGARPKHGASAAQTTPAPRDFVGTELRRTNRVRAAHILGIFFATSSALH